MRIFYGTYMSDEFGYFGGNSMEFYIHNSNNEAFAHIKTTIFHFSFYCYYYCTRVQLCFVQDEFRLCLKKFLKKKKCYYFDSKRLRLWFNGAGHSASCRRQCPQRTDMFRSCFHHPFRERKEIRRKYRV